MPVSSPLPSNLPKECKQAAAIFSSFSSIIPSEILRGARGFAILTIAKAGFLFSARAGSGLVLVKLQNGSWSAPSAIGTGGLGVGGQAGAELSEFVIILNSKAAVQSFMTAGSINLGGNLSVAVGPVGRNAEASGSLNKFSTMYSYSRTRGLFGGASLEGSVIFERSDANTKAYSPYVDFPSQITARNILSGSIEPPPWAGLLIQAIERRVGTMFDSTWINDAPSDDEMEERRKRGYSFGTEGIANQSSSSSPAAREKSTRLERIQTDTDGDGSIKGKKGRMRGYSLGSFGRSKLNSGASSPTSERRPGGGRDRAYTSSATTTRFREDDNDSDVDDNDPDPYRDFNPSSSTRSSRTTTLRDAEDAYHDDVDSREDLYDNNPVSPTSTVSSTSRSQRFTEFMKRPVLPNRKSTSAISTSRSTTEQRGSPLGGRSRSGTVASRASSSKKGKLEYSGKYSSSGDDDDDDDDDEGPEDIQGQYANVDRDDASEDGNDRRGPLEDQASPFGDRFGEVEHRFSDNEEEEGDASFRRSNTTRRRGDSSSNSRYSDKQKDNSDSRNRSGSGGGIVSNLTSSLSRPNFTKRNSSSTNPSKGAHLGASASSAVTATTSAVKGVFKARPGLAKRSATAPSTSRSSGGSGVNGKGDKSMEWSNRRGGIGIGGYRDDEFGNTRDDSDDDGRERDCNKSFGSNGRGMHEDLNDILIMSDNRRSGAGGHSTEDGGSDTEEERERAGDIRIKRPDNPFAESSSNNGNKRRGLYTEENGGEEYFSSTRENREIIDTMHDDGDHLQDTGFKRSPSNSSLSSSATLERTSASHPSKDIYANRRAFIKQTEADFHDHLDEGPRFLKTDTRQNSYQAASSFSSSKEYRVALFDFEGAESGDLSFQTGDVIEIISKDDPDWWLGRLKMKEGIVPVNRTKVYKP